MNATMYHIVSFASYYWKNTLGFQTPCEGVIGPQKPYAKDQTSAGMTGRLGKTRGNLHHLFHCEKTWFICLSHLLQVELWRLQMMPYKMSSVSQFHSSISTLVARYVRRREAANTKMWAVEDSENTSFRWTKIHLDVPCPGCSLWKTRIPPTHRVEKCSLKRKGSLVFVSKKNKLKLKPILSM